MNDKLALYKLIILYMLNEVNSPMTTAQISEFVLSEGYTTFFKIQESLNDLADSDFLKIEATHTRTLYHLTEEGAKAVHYFKDRISPAIIQDIQAFLKEKQYDLQEEAGVKSNYYENDQGEFVVRCRIVENYINLIDLKLVVPTEAEAKAIAGNWTRVNQAVYARVLGTLL
ncbi:MAG: DUF4364 family protein [Lachnospiraceae bacterium]|nr:DUF4364 family protein [Lachnospiraceae bacterium]